MTGKQPKRKKRPGVDEYGRTKLHYAANDGRNFLCRLLLLIRFDPNKQDDNGWSPLHFAAQAKSAAVTKALLASGAKVELRDSYGNAPLWVAVVNSKGNGEVIRLLRAAGADPHAENNNGMSPLKLARKTISPDARQAFSDLP